MECSKVFPVKVEFELNVTRDVKRGMNGKRLTPGREISINKGTK